MLFLVYRVAKQCNSQNQKIKKIKIKNENKRKKIGEIKWN